MGSSRERFGLPRRRSLRECARSPTHRVRDSPLGHPHPIGLQRVPMGTTCETQLSAPSLLSSKSGDSAHGKDLNATYAIASSANITTINVADGFLTGTRVADEATDGTIGKGGAAGGAVAVSDADVDAVSGADADADAVSGADADAVSDASAGASAGAGVGAGVGVGRETSGDSVAGRGGTGVFRGVGLVPPPGGAGTGDTRGGRSETWESTAFG